VHGSSSGSGSDGGSSGSGSECDSEGDGGHGARSTPERSALQSC
jgi:hypothetical protein